MAINNDLIVRSDIKDFIQRAESNDLVGALRNEFSKEMERLGVNTNDLSARVTALENRRVPPPRFTSNIGLLYRSGTNAAINSGGAQGAVRDLPFA